MNSKLENGMTKMFHSLIDKSLKIVHIMQTKHPHASLPQEINNTGQTSLIFR